MTGTALTPKYDLYIEAFEKLVTAKQKEIEHSRGMEPIYNVVRPLVQDFTDATGYDLNLKLTPHCVYIECELGSSQFLSKFDELSAKIGAALVMARLRTDPIGTTANLTSFPGRYWLWNSYDGTNVRRVDLTVRLPLTGCADFSIRKQDVTINYIEYHLEPRIQGDHNDKAHNDAARL